MKLMILAALAAVSAVASQANACDAGVLCRNKAAVFEDVKAFSARISCATLSDQQALDVAGRVLNSELSYQSFKDVYAQSCNIDTAYNVARDSRVAGVFIDVKAFSARISCATFNDQQAAQIGYDVVSNRIALPALKAVYQQSCNLQTAYTASSQRGMSEVFLDLKSFSARISCATFTDAQALEVGNDVLAGQNTIEDFKAVYQQSCNLATALEASRCVPTAGAPRTNAYPAAPPLAPVTIQPRGPRHHRRFARN